MKRPVNKSAVELWILAAIVLLGEAASLEALREGMSEMGQRGGQNFLVTGSFWKVFLGGVLSAAHLAAFGVIIELVAQIRNARHRDK